MLVGCMTLSDHERIICNPNMSATPSAAFDFNKSSITCAMLGRYMITTRTECHSQFQFNQECSFHVKSHDRECHFNFIYNHKMSFGGAFKQTTPAQISCHAYLLDAKLVEGPDVDWYEI